MLFFTNKVMNMESMHHSDQDLRPVESLLETDTQILDASEREKHRLRFQRGLKWMGIGAIILVFSFGLNFLIYQCGGDCSTPMYILTSIGALSCLKGMMDIF
jgi:hypothetical protein